MYKFIAIYFSALCIFGNLPTEIQFIMSCYLGFYLIISIWNRINPPDSVEK